MSGRTKRFTAAAVAMSACIAIGLAPLSAAEPTSSGAAVPDYGITQVKVINEMVRKHWQENGIKPSKPASDGQWCRRVYLDIIGRIPSVDELQAFLSDRSADKRKKLVLKLLGDDHVEEYARNMTTIWTNILIGRNGGNEDRSLTNREGMQQYLRRAFLSNKPYDKMVEELVTAEGTNKPGMADYNGAVNFLAMKLDDKGAQATAKTAQIFLATQVQCTQCHNHPFNEWKQDQFWEMNAFFRQTVALRRFDGRDIDYVELTNQDFAGEDNNASEAAVFFENRNGTVNVAYPTFIDGKEISSRSGYVSEVNRRQELAKMIVESDQMPRAIVNRMWSHFLGYGFTKPIDDMGPHNQPTHPELLDKLGEYFRYYGCNLKTLMYWIALSEPYSLSSQMVAGNVRDDPSLGERPAFSHFYLRQMRAEELYESLLVATQAHKTQGSYADQEKAKREWLKQFVVAFGTDEGDEATTFNGSIPQVLMMMNGELMTKATSVEQGGFLHRVAADNSLSNAAKINFLYQAALAREPRSREVQLANTLLAARRGNTPVALQDIWWVLLNSNEFIFNH